MFQFPSFPTHSYVFTVRYLILHQVCSHIRKSAGRCLFTAHRSLSQLVTSFIGSWCQGIHLTLFFAWTYIWFSNQISFELLEFRKQIRFLLVTHWKSFLCSFRNLESFFHLAVKLYFFTLYWKDLSNLFFKIKSVLFLSVRFTLQYTLFGFQWTYSFVKPLCFTGRPGWTRTIDLTLIRRAL